MNPINTSRADGMTYEEVASLFVEPDGWDVVTARRHVIVFGPRDAGKTILLRYLSLPAQARVRGSVRNVEFVGIYVPMTPAICNPFLPAYSRDPDHWELFGDYFDLLIAQRVLDTLQEVEDELCLAVAKSVSQHLDLSLSPIRNLEGEQWIDKIWRRQDDILNVVESTQSLAPQANIPCTQPGIFVPRLVDVVGRACRGFLGRQIAVFILLDGYENLGPLAQVVNILIDATQSTACFLKIGARRFGDQIKGDIWGRRIIRYGLDYDVVPIGLHAPLSEQYVELARKIVNRQLEKPEAGLLVRQDIAALLGPPTVSSGEQLVLEGLGLNELSTRLPAFRARDRDSRRNNYHGFLTYAFLSSGAARTFLRLCHGTIGRAAELGRSKMEKAEMSEFAVRFAEREFENIMAIVQDYNLARSVQRLVYWLGREAEREFEEALKRGVTTAEAAFLKVCVTNLDSPAAEDVLRTLRAAHEAGLLRVEDSLGCELAGATPTTFSVMAAFAPLAGLKPIVASSSEYSTEYIKSLINQPHKGEPGVGVPIVRTKAASGKRIFLAIQFTKDPEWSVDARRVLKRFFSAYLLGREKPLSQAEYEQHAEKPCYDAEDMAEGTEIGEKAFAGLREANYALFEVAARNPSVFYELGMAMAIGTSWAMIWNDARGYGEDFDTATLPRFLQTVLIQPYQLSRKGQIRNARDFVRKVMGYLEKLERQNRCPVHPKDPCEFDPTMGRYAFSLFTPAGDEWTSANKAIRELLEQKGLKEVILPTGVSTKPELCHVCYKVKASRLCIVDSTGEKKPNPAGYFILGMSDGLGDRVAVNLHRDIVQPITMRRARPIVDIPWTLGETMSRDIITGLDKAINATAEEV